jgi:hypothetical protein
MSQELPDLGDYSISALLGMGVDERTFCPWFKFAALSQLMTLRVVGLVYMSCSRAWRYRMDIDSNVMEISSKKRMLTPEDLSGYAWSELSPQMMPELVVIKVAGDLNLTIICDSFEVALEPLNRQFPHMV